LTIAALSLCGFSELGEMTKKFCNKKANLSRTTSLQAYHSARTFDSIHGIRQLQNRLSAG